MKINQEYNCVQEIMGVLACRLKMSPVSSSDNEKKAICIFSGDRWWHFVKTSRACDLCPCGSRISIKIGDQQ